MPKYEDRENSASVALLSEIAHQLNRCIFSFFEQKGDPFVQIKLKSQRSISSHVLKIKLVGPRKSIADNFVVTYEELKKGKRIDFHTNKGTEYNYNIEGKCELKVNGQSYFLNAGDSSVFNARLEHSVTALEKLKFFGIFLEDKP